jgi:hypothetical protein
MDMNVICGRRLTGFGVAPDGESIAIDLMDEESRPATLLLPAWRWQIGEVGRCGS